jgi:hypothetical protein
MPKVIKTCMPEVNEQNIDILTDAATSPDAFESKCINAAYHLAYKRLISGEATSQETTYFLKLGSKVATLEMKKLEADTKKAEAQAKALDTSKEQQAYDKVIDALMSYRGVTNDNE